MAKNKSKKKVFYSWIDDENDELIDAITIDHEWHENAPEKLVNSLSEMASFDNQKTHIVKVTLEVVKTFKVKYVKPKPCTHCDGKGVK